MPRLKLKFHPIDYPTNTEKECMRHCIEGDFSVGEAAHTRKCWTKVTGKSKHRWYFQTRNKASRIGECEVTICTTP